MLPLFVSLAVSCKRDEALDIRNTEYISFKINDDALAATGVLTKGSCDTLSYEITDWDYTGEESDTDVQTKGTLTETLTGEVGVFAAVGTTPVMNNAKHTVNGSELVPETKVLWKNYTSGTMKIFAYAPYKAGTTAGTDASFTYTVANTISDQEDLLYATASKTCSPSDRTAIPLAFKHGLTAIQFRMGFACKVKSITISNVKNSGKFYLDGTTPSVFSGSATYTLSYGDGKDVAQDSIVNKGNEMLILMPQAFDSDDQTISLTYNNGVKDTSISAKLNGTDAWPAGKKVTYTLKKTVPAGTVDYVYFDFTAGDIVLTNSTYKGYVFVNGTATEVSGTHNNSLKYYIYQSAPDTTAAAKSNAKIKSSYAGYTSESDIGAKKPTLPKYTTIEVNGKSWGEYITNNTDPLTVVKKWNSFTENFLEPGSPHRILIWGDAAFDITLDRVYSRYYPYVRLMNGDTYTDAENYVYNGIKVTAKENDIYGGITIGMDEFGHECQIKQKECWGSGSNKNVTFLNKRTYKERVTLRLKGNNYFSRIDYSKPVSNTNSGYLKITSADGDGIANGTLTVTLPEDMGTNRERRSPGAILGGGSPNGDNNLQREVSDISFDGGIVYVGVDSYNNSNWNDSKYNVCPIGGNNGAAEIAITGGILTSVVYGPGPAIGGGAGWNYASGRGTITISGGTTYAHCFGVYNAVGNKFILGSAIGGGSTAGTYGTSGAEGIVTITGGNVHAYSVGGVAIGGGTSGGAHGGNATINISGGKIYAQSVNGTIAGKDVIAGVSIGGGRGGKSSGVTGNGGQATINISGSAYVQAGSIGGGKSDEGKIGQANVTIYGGETSGQFLLVAGSSGTNSFSMTGGTINNSKTSDTEYKKVQSNGGAVYMESGTCNISGTGSINKCSASIGGAIYMKGGTFSMSGGKISDCTSAKDGGAVFIEGGSATVSGGEIYHNIASKGNGGGVYIKGGNFTMTGGKINNNASDSNKEASSYYGGNGGGIYVSSSTSDPVVSISGGEITYNAADRNGGGLCVDMSDAGDHKATITIGNEDVAKRDTLSPDIRLNSAALSGGGMAVQGNGSNITIYSGTVKGNVSAYVKNEDIRNDGGLVELVGKNEEGKEPQVNVHYNTITFYANNGNDPEPYDEQRVITSTNSLLKPTETALAFELEFYHIASWNTKRDGTGTKYTADGRDPNTGKSAIMNITSDVSLYAQWKKNQ